MNIGAYLQRIDYHGSVSPTTETLRALHIAHMLSVPFENLSIHSGETIVLDTEWLYDKIINRKRGGFCYELNGLFAWLLAELGFEVRLLSAQVSREAGGFGPEFDHMALMVGLERRWLVDVGFGDSFLEPLLLDERSEQAQGIRCYRIDQDKDSLIMLQRELEGDWKPQYKFTLREHSLGDYEEMCRYHQTSPQSGFTKGKICSMPTEDGRITLSGMRFITTSGSTKDEVPLGSEHEYGTILKDSFGIEIRK